MIVISESSIFQTERSNLFTLINMTQAPETEAKPVIDVLLVGLGSIGTVYAYMLEKVSLLQDV